MPNDHVLRLSKDRDRAHRQAQGALAEWLLQLRADVQTDLGIDQRILTGGDSVDDQRSIDRDVALDHAESDRAEFEVPGGAADEADSPTIRFERGAGSGQGVDAAIKVQPDEPAWRPSRAGRSRSGSSIVGIQADPGHAGTIRSASYAYSLAITDVTSKASVS